MSTGQEHAAPLPLIGAPQERSPFTAGREALWDVVLQQVGHNLEKRGFGVSIACTLQDAREHVLNELLPASKAKVVSFGGSMTVREAGLLEALKARPELTVMDTFDMSIGLEAMLELRRQALLSDFFLCSANALTRNGELLLVDGFGNRTAAVQYGPKKVVLLVGRNKICADVDEAVNRLKHIAAPANAARLNKKTPCVKTGHCMDCNSPDRICSYWTLAQRSLPAGRIHILLINQQSGF